MPLPVFVIGAAAAVGAGLLGAKKAYNAHETNKRAERINTKASNSVKYAKSKAKKSRNACQKSLEKLGTAKLDILKNEIMPFVQVFKKIHNIEFRDSEGLNELSKMKLTKEEFNSIAKLGSIAEKIVNGAAGGVAAGALAAIGAYGAATTFGVVAGTGTAIGTLSGVAATNATLAFLGGGSLAAGGLGMAGGACVLGGLVAGPALAVMGLVLNSRAEENLENAKANRAEAEKIAEQCTTICTMCDAISERCDLFTDVLDKLSERLHGANAFLKKLVKKYADGRGNADFRKFDDEERKLFAAACSLVQAVKSILDTPILKENGKLTRESGTLAKKMAIVVDDGNRQSVKPKAIADKSKKGKPKRSTHLLPAYKTKGKKKSAR